MSNSYRFVLDSANAWPRPRTKMMLILGNMDIAFQTSFLPNDGVGMARMEFIITEYVQAHPMALLYPEKINDPQARAAILAFARHFDGPSDRFQ